MTAGGAGVGEQLLSAARITAPILDESKIGFIVTNGDPTGKSDNNGGRRRFPVPQIRFYGRQAASRRCVLRAQFVEHVGQDELIRHADRASERTVVDLFSASSRWERISIRRLDSWRRSSIREYQGRFAYKDRPTGSLVRWWGKPACGTTP